MIGLKLLREDGTSLREEGRVYYPPNEEIIVGGNGAYVAISDGLTCGGKGPLLVALECEDPTGAYAPDGVRCFRRVRRIGNGIPSQPVLEKYERVCDEALKEYYRVCDEALKEYNRIRDEALKEYYRIRDEALKEYYRVHDEAEKECERVCDEARGEYNRICDEEYEEYKRVHDEAWKEIVEKAKG